MIADTATDVLGAILTAQIVGIIYLAVAVSKLRADIARIEGRLQQRERDNGR